jgi:hypothetical protein
MSINADGWDAVCFLVSGGDPNALVVHPDIAKEERRVARDYTFILLGLLILNFLCTSLSAYEVFIDLQPTLTLYGYLALVVLPISFFWTLMVFCILRFMIQIGHDKSNDAWQRFRRVLSMSPAWCILPMIGLMASAPLQIRAMSDDIRLNSVMTHWKRLSTDLIDIQLLQARAALLNQHNCVTSLMRPEVIVNPAGSLIKLVECRQAIELESPDAATQAYSLRLLDAIYREIKDDGLIARVNLAYDAAPGTTWLIALIMISLFSSPILTRMLARKRAYEYLQYDRGRRNLMEFAGIELHAHDAFDKNGNAVQLHRYRRVEAEASFIRDKYEAKKEEVVQQLRLKSEAIKHHN